MRAKWIVVSLIAMALVMPQLWAASASDSPVSPKAAQTSLESVPINAPLAPTGKGTRHSLGEFDYTESREDGVTYVYGTIQGQIKWTRAKSPYVMIENVWVDEKGVLTIESGTLIKVVRPEGIDVYKDEGIRLHVRGLITAIGDPKAPIRFTAASTQPKKIEEWDGVHLFGSGQNRMEWVIVEYARFGFDCTRSCVISRCVARYCFGGIYLNRDFSGDIFNNVCAYNVNGVTLNGATGGGVFNCILYNNENAAIKGVNNPNCYVGYNLCYPLKARKTSGKVDENIPGEHDVNADPSFVAPAAGDFRLSANSPARRAGYAGADMGLYPEGWGKDPGK
ncbi:MAG: hypothetical protein Q7T82_05805 [Armatimonadota bacterium]|nr:hypothetical protein [Armatimonadota bacterium]